MTDYEKREVIRKAISGIPLLAANDEKMELYEKHRLILGHNPVDRMRITSQYGKRPPVTVNGVTKDKFHNGIDIGAVKPGVVGDPTYATDDGIVKEVRFFKEGYGNTIVIDYGLYCAFYCHLFKIKVKVNQVVKSGELVGLMGSSGFSEAAHLHFGLTAGSYTSKYWMNNEQGYQINGINPSLHIRG